MRAIHTRAYWGLMRVAAEVHEINGVTFADWKPDEEVPVDGRQVRRTIELALEEMDLAGPEYAPMVRDNLKAIVRSRNLGPFAYRHLRIYMSPFSKTECSDPRLLAARLVMAARYFETANAGNLWSNRLTEEQARWHARQTQDWFIRRLPDWKDWMARVAAMQYR